MNYKEIKILGVGISNISKEDLIKILRAGSREDDSFYIVTPNPEIIYLATIDERLKEILNNAKYKIPDGIGLLLASRILRKPLKERVSGVEIFDLLGNVGKVRIFLLGSKEEIVKKTADILVKKFNNIEAIEYHDGYFTPDQDEKIIEKIRNFKPRILFVGLGCPKQEEWIFENYKKTNADITVGIGGSFDVISGYKMRAPFILRKIGLEWFFRFLQEPRRRWKRLIRLPMFLIMVVCSKFLSLNEKCE